MAAFGVRINCYATGITLIHLSMVVERSGSNNDNCKMRVVRRRAGYGDVVLTGEATFSMLSDATARTWQWVDPNVPVSGEWDYVLQVKKLDGNGTFEQMLLTAIHSKR
jgi:hypothetical protein